MNKRLLGQVSGMSKEELIHLRAELGYTEQRLKKAGYGQAAHFVYLAATREIDRWEQAVQGEAGRPKRVAWED